MTKKKRPMSLGKKLLIAALIVALVVGGCYLGYYLIRFTFYNGYRQYIRSHSYEEGSKLSLSSKKLEGYKDFKLAVENDTLGLYLNEKDSNVAILDKRSGEITFATPPDAKNDPIANKTNKNYLRSPIIVRYYNASRAEGVYDAYSMAIERGQVSYESISDGIRIIYELGDFSNSMGTVSQFLSVERFNELCANLDEKGAAELARYYPESKKASGMLELRSNIINNTIIRRKVEALLIEAGFTDEDVVEQMALAGEAVAVPISFKIPLEYRLVGDAVEASIVTSAIEEKGGAAVFRIDLLRSFAAADSSVSGYMVVPSGDGGLINFNNGKTAAANYSQYIYDIDPIAADYTVLEKTSPAKMPLFGICRENATILATIEDGDALALVTAGVSGKTNNYNTAYATFVLRGRETLEMFGTTGNEASLPLVEPKLYDCTLRVRYTFLDEEHQGYSGIANYYRDRLISEGVLTPRAPEESIKFYYDVIAGVKMPKFILGKKYSGLTAMTTFEEAQEMARILARKGISNQVMNLQGWFNGGYYHDAASKIRIPWKLGSKKDLEDLNATLETSGGRLYADVIFQKVPYLSKYYNYNAESSKYYSGYVVGLGQVNPVTLRQTASLGYTETKYDLISPKFLVRYTQAFAKKFQNYDVDGISLRDLGSTLQSDKKRTNIINRQQALDVVKAQLELLAERKDIMVNMANSYAWNVADDILNLPLSNNQYTIMDQDIPLYEMIIHGSIDYSGEVYNLSDAADVRNQVLRMIEYGASPHFAFTWQNTSEMKYSGMNRDYSTTFQVWMEDAITLYEQVNEALCQVSGATMVSHEILEGGVRRVSYSNGKVILLNRSEEAVTLDGVEIPAMGYLVTERGM